MSLTCSRCLFYLGIGTLASPLPTEFSDNRDAVMTLYMTSKLSPYTSSVQDKYSTVWARYPSIQQSAPQYVLPSSFIRPVHGPPYSKNPETEALIQFAHTNLAQYKNVPQTGQ